MPQQELNDSRIISEIIGNALAEDLGSGDVTGSWIIPPEKTMTGRLTAKEDGVLAGLELAGEVFTFLDGSVVFTPKACDGMNIKTGREIAVLKGPARAILAAERTALNIMQRMSGIASETRKFVKAVEGTDAVILDTRKTVPGLRLLDKLAVKTGGGRNHRFGLFDMVLIKENHITTAGSITDAVGRVRAHSPGALEIEVEVRNLDELREALDLSVDRVMLDNMTVDEMRQAVEISGGRVPLEASGNITIERVRSIAETGVDFISIGSLTHSVKALDISLLLEAGEGAL